MELRNIKTFLKVADMQSFSHAADFLGYSQSAVTMQIQQLEEELGVKLFDRIGKNIRLTDDGRTFAGHAVKVVKSANDAANSVKEREEITGTLRIGVAESLAMNVLPAALSEFQKRCPGVEVIIKTAAADAKDLHSMLTANQVDMVFFLDRLVYNSEWVKVFEIPEPTYFVAPSSHPLASERSVSLDAILSEPMMLTEKSISYRYELEQTLARRGYELHPVLEAGNTDLIVKMLLNSGGISFVPYYAVRDYVKRGQLSLIKCEETDIQVFNQLIYHRRKWMTPQLEIFIDILKETALQNR